MADLTEVEVEMFRPKEATSQLWKREVAKEGMDGKKDWQVDFIHEDYEYLMDEDRANEIPEYAVKGRMIITSAGRVKQAYMKNPNFDETKIVSCKLRKNQRHTSTF